VPPPADLEAVAQAHLGLEVALGVAARANTPATLDSLRPIAARIAGDRAPSLTRGTSTPPAWFDSHSMRRSYPFTSPDVETRTCG